MLLCCTPYTSPKKSYMIKRAKGTPFAPKISLESLYLTQVMRVFILVGGPLLSLRVPSVTGLAHPRLQHCMVKHTSALNDSLGPR